MDKGKVLIAAPVHSVLTEGLEADGYEILLHENIVQEDAYKLVYDCVGIITSTRLMLDKKLIDAAPSLKWIGRMGSGMEIIDTNYASEKGVNCYSSPEGNCNAVGEHALGMLLSLTKKITVSNIEVRRGEWNREQNRGTELEGKTIGIIGFGHTGRAFTRKLQGFDMNILVYDIDEKIQYPFYVGAAELQQIQKEADIISFHVPFTLETQYYFDEAFLYAMQKQFILINTSRGAIVNTEAVYNGIKQGKIIGVTLDVLEQEPLAKLSVINKMMVKEMLEMPEVIITPHIAGYSFEGVFKMSEALLLKIVMNTSNK